MSLEAAGQVVGQLAQLRSSTMLDEEQKRDLDDVQQALEALGYVFESAAMLIPAPREGTLHAPLELPAHNMAGLMRVLARTVERAANAPMLGTAVDLAPLRVAVQQ